jgi:hypothetical protein
VAREGHRLRVRGCDLLDQTPIFDIKPYLPYADAFADAKAGWLDQITTQPFAVEFTEFAARQLRWLEDEGLSQLRGFLMRQLEFDPLDSQRKRVNPAPQGGHVLAYRTWRAMFSLDEVARKITIEWIKSGYDANDLAEGSEDPYADKDLHRRFLKNGPSPLGC